MWSITGGVGRACACGVAGQSRDQRIVDRELELQTNLRGDFTITEKTLEGAFSVFRYCKIFANFRL